MVAQAERTLIDAHEVFMKAQSAWKEADLGARNARVVENMNDRRRSRYARPSAKGIDAAAGSSRV